MDEYSHQPSTADPPQPTPRSAPFGFLVSPWLSVAMLLAFGSLWIANILDSAVAGALAVIAAAGLVACLAPPPES